MTKKFSIAVDAMGGDNAPKKVLEGINLLFKNKVDVHVDISQISSVRWRFNTPS